MDIEYGPDIDKTTNFGKIEERYIVHAEKFINKYNDTKHVKTCARCTYDMLPDEGEYIINNTIHMKCVYVNVQFLRYIHNLVF